MLTDAVQKNIDRISIIISSLRNLSRGMANIEKECFPINQIISEAINLAKIKSKFMEINFINNIDFGVEIYGHQGQIVQVILNLFNNAIDAISHQEDPWIKIDAEVTDRELFLYISDSGKKIDQATIKKMFLPLFTTKEIGKGTGIGLSLSKSFMEQNGGTLSYEDSYETTCFKLTLRLAQQNPKKESA